MDTKVVTAHLPLELADKLESYARSMDRSKGWIVKQALANWIDWEEKKDRLTLEAAEAADAADKDLLIDHADLKAWVERLATDAPLRATRGK